jgi:hypothetical protein
MHATVELALGPFQDARCCHELGRTRNPNKPPALHTPARATTPPTTALADWGLSHTPLTQRAARGQLVAEGRAALHAARRLRVKLVLARRSGHVLHHLLPVRHALVNGAVAERRAVVLQEAAALCVV